MQSLRQTNALQHPNAIGPRRLVQSRPGRLPVRPDDIARQLGTFAAATLYEAAGKCGGMSAEIRPIVPRARLAGIAFTVRTLGAETAAVLRAIEIAPPGAVLLIDTGALGTAPVWGGTSSLASKLRGLAGCVTNGCVRDVDEIIEVGMPVYAAAVSVIGTLKNHPGWHGVPITLGGVSVQPGDYVVGDSDGVVVIPAADALRVIDAATVQRDKEHERDARIRAGEPITAVVGLR